MNQRTNYSGMSLLDCAKAAIEHFVKIRSRDPATQRGDRYFLVTCEEGLGAIKAGWRESFNVFMQEVKNLVARDVSAVGPAIKKALDLLNQFRIQTSIDNYGQGRIPWFIEPAVIILLTDGSSLTNNSAVLDTLTLPLHPTSAGSELTVEPFRWDQRLFTLVLQLGATGLSGAQETDITNKESLMTPMSEVTGGTCQTISSMKGMMSAIESLITKLSTGIVVNLENAAPSASSTVTAPSVQHKLIYVRPNSGGFWPIPESFFPDPNMSQLPPRSAQPSIKFLPVDSDPFIYENFPFDKYEIESSALTNYFLTHKQSATVCWHVYIAGSSSGTSKLGEPFGFLKASTSQNTVNLFVLPYNFPVLWPLLDELLNINKLTITPKWRQDFEKYLQSIPNYYYPTLRNAFKRMNLPSIIPDHYDGGPNYNIINYFKKLKQQCKIESDRFLAAIKQAKDNALNVTIPTTGSNPNVTTPRTSTPLGLGAVPRNFHRLLDKSTERNIYQDQNEAPFSASVVEDTLLTDQSATGLESISYSTHKNVFDFQRNSLLDQIHSIQAFLAKPKQQSDAKHMVSISAMGNYQEVLAKKESLREIDEDKKRPALFGNPFKMEKNTARSTQALIDEAEEEGFNSSSINMLSGTTNSKPTKRKLPTPAPPSVKQKFRKTGSQALVHPQIPPSPQPESPISTPPSSPQMPPPSPSLSETEIEMSAEQLPSSDLQMKKKPQPIPAVNAKLKADITKILRKPGKNYDEVFNHLKLLQGDNASKKAFVEDIIQEAKRIKKTQLVTQLEAYEKTL
mmetsp:Transcript_11630/g.16135  ORF Transcript_11630/g.16135 Transcript_11630/m.16135 type:complete len:793 (+) Transcript_11630:2-2380(+)